MYLVELLMCKTYILPVISFSYLPWGKSYDQKYWFWAIVLAAILDFTNLDKPGVILMHLLELPICENLYFATNIIKLSTLEQKLWPF